MKKEETYKRNTTFKNECDFRSRSLSPKAYLGCDTCRSKKVKSNNKLSDWNNAHDRYKRKKSFNKREEEEKEKEEEEEKEVKNQKIKLTDLCDEDKGRIVELIEELSMLEEKNQQLKQKLDEVQKERQDQQDHMFKQANLFLEEKNFFVNEINRYKNKLEAVESEMNNKISRWENSGRLKDSKIIYFAKALQKSLKEKNELHALMNRLKNCLKNSLDSFQKLKSQVTELQCQDMKDKKFFKSACCQTENLPPCPPKERRVLSDGETEEEEFFSACNQNHPKNSLEVMNDKLEYVYQCFKKNKEKFPTSPPQKYDIDLSILLKSDGLTKDEGIEDVYQKNEDDSRKGENNEEEEMFLKPQKKCSKTLLEVETILKNIGHPLNVIVNECSQVLESNNLNVATSKEPTKELMKFSNFLQNKIVQKNSIFKLSDDDQYEEDRILEELFYSDQSLNLGLDSILKLETKCYNDRPFTW